MFPGEIRPRGDVAAHDDGRPRPFTADDLAQGPGFFHVGPDGADAHDVVGRLADLAHKGLERGEVENRAGGVDVGLHHEKAEGAVKHPQGKAALQAGDLVVVQLHGVDPAASVLVVAGERPEDACQEDPGLRALRVRGDGGMVHG